MYSRPWATVLAVVALLCGAVLFAGCTGTDSGGELNETPSVPANETVDETVNETMNETVTPAITGTGTVTYIDLEGGFYGIIGDDGARYLPLDLEEAYQQDGLEVRFTLTPAEGMVTIQQWGMPVNVVSIEEV